ncbi:serine hydrolase [Sporosarcina sp. D27]|uniref:serine hydrolase domain-containing protein n=1 Tax=Sporosarcina sp. D27 TaxID=1382305 RepID=UPI000471B78B|nr:serine hydrolase [Sporosarcina sp. D27]
MNIEAISTYLDEKQKELSFSGAFYGRKGDNIITGSHGYANWSDKIENQLNTRFSIASGCKIFTATAICMLIEEGKLTFDSKLSDCVAIEFPHFNSEITIHQLLTHTSGVPDYFNEDVMEDYEELWEKRSAYNVRSPKDFLPLFQHEPMQAEPGRSFQYNNSGYILLGLIIEHVAKIRFTEFVEDRIFRKADMQDSGYFEMDRLPARTALGYIENATGTWKTNIYSLPAKGGPDGGAYTTVSDMAKFWDALTTKKLLSEEMTANLVKPREVVDEDRLIYYGYGGYMKVDHQHNVVKYIQMGYDPGVNFRAAYAPKEEAMIVVCSNKSDGAFAMLKEIEGVLELKI